MLACPWTSVSIVRPTFASMRCVRRSNQELVRGLTVIKTSVGKRPVQPNNSQDVKCVRICVCTFPRQCIRTIELTLRYHASMSNDVWLCINRHFQNSERPNRRRQAKCLGSAVWDVSTMTVNVARRQHRSRVVQRERSSSPWTQTAGPSSSDHKDILSDVW